MVGGILLLYLGVVAYGSYQIQANYFINSINKGKGKAVALTFDDGPDPDQTPKILEILAEKNVKATFFVIGKKALRHPDLLRQIVDDGHEIANHSFSHSYFIAFFSRRRLTKDLGDCNDAIFDATGKKPAFFRPPFGVTNPRYGNAIQENGMISIGWSLRSFDTQAKSKYALIDKVISTVKKGDIILLHDRMPVTNEALGDIIEYILSRKLSIEPLSVVVNKKPYVQI